MSNYSKFISIARIIRPLSRFRIVTNGKSKGKGKGKSKVVPVLFLITDHHAMKAYGGVEV
jgi:hypothetical protein